MGDVECVQTLDGKHHYAPRKYLKRGGHADPNVPENWYSEVRCKCGDHPPDDAEVREQLAATARERSRQADLSRREVTKAMQAPGLEWSKQQPKLDL